ncbi:MAG: glycine cleavage system protein H [Desulfatitalea sp.]|nr:glycine cleavage system protein H [Desulfatitalea sp.]
MTAPAPQKKAKGQPIVFGATHSMCVWSRAGVVKPMACINAFDCLGCAFDQKVQKNYSARGALPDRAASDPRPPRLHLLVNQRKCRHMLSGRVTYKLCGHGYDCARCPYDQMIEDAATYGRLSAPACENVGGFNVAKDYYYHHGHTWARVEYGGRIRIGIDDFAARLLGPQDRVEVPKLGETVGQNRQGAELTRGEHKAFPLSPVDGKVVAVNAKLTGRAHVANEAPYADGWLMVVQPTRMRSNLKNLFFGDESTAWMDDEAGRLSTLLSESSEIPLAATGGEALLDIFGSVPGADWHLLVSRFLV